MSHLNLIVDMWVLSLVNSLYGQKFTVLVLFICVFLRMPPKAATLTRATRSSGASLGKTLPAMSTPAKRGPKGKKDEVGVVEPEVVFQTPADVARKKVATLKAAVDAADAQRAKDLAALDAAAQDLEDCVVNETKPKDSEDRKKRAQSRSRSPRRRSYSPRRRSRSPGRRSRSPNRRRSKSPDSRDRWRRDSHDR